MTQESSLSPVKNMHFYESAKWRLLSYALWLGMILLVAVVGIMVDAGSISNISGGVFFGSVLQSWLITAMIIPPMVMLVASGHIDLSVGALAGYVAASTAFVMIETGAGAWMGILIAIRTALLIGLLHGILVGLLKVHSAIVTLGTATLLRGMTLQIANQALVLQNADSFSWLTIPTIILMLVFVIALIFIAEFTPLGKKRAADLPGDEAWLPRLLRAAIPHLFVSLAAGFAGLLLLVRFNSALSTMGLGLEVDVLLPIFMAGIPLGGGLINIIGAMIASLYLGVKDGLSAVAGDPAGQALVVQGFQLFFFAGLGKLYLWAADKIHQKRANAK